VHILIADQILGSQEIHSEKYANVLMLLAEEKLLQCIIDRITEMEDAMELK
jgi:hypothetical protein